MTDLKRARAMGLFLGQRGRGSVRREFSWKTRGRGTRAPGRREGGQRAEQLVGSAGTARSFTVGHALRARRLPCISSFSRRDAKHFFIRGLGAAECEHPTRLTSGGAGTGLRPPRRPGRVPGTRSARLLVGQGSSFPEAPRGRHP